MHGQNEISKRIKETSGGGREFSDFKFLKHYISKNWTIVKKLQLGPTKKKCNWTPNYLNITTCAKN
jgi:hypothetical protein